jgi:hypothetical protein
MFIAEKKQHEINFLGSEEKYTTTLLEELIKC